MKEAGTDEGAFRIGFVDGVTPDKWLRRWRERRRDQIVGVPVAEDDQRGVLDRCEVEMCLVRLPVERDRLHLIELYAEDLVVVTSTDHALTALADVTRDDLLGEHVGDGAPRAAIGLAAAGTGVVVVPRSVARMHGRKDVAVRRLVDDAGDVVESRVGLAWRRDLDDERAEVFVGIVRGRTPRSSRG